MGRTRSLLTLASCGFVFAALGSCGNSSGENQPQASPVTKTATQTETVTKTETAPGQDGSPSPSPSFSTADDFLWAIRNHVPTAQEWSDTQIFGNAHYVCDQNEKGATWQEMTEFLTTGVADLTQHEADSFATDALGACSLSEVADFSQ